MLARTGRRRHSLQRAWSACRFCCGEQRAGRRSRAVCAMAEFMEQGAVGFYKSASLFAAARQWGLPIEAAYAVQGAGVLVSLWLLWLVRGSTSVRAGCRRLRGRGTFDTLFARLRPCGCGSGSGLFVRRGLTQRVPPLRKIGHRPHLIAPWISRQAAQVLTLPMGALGMVLLARVAARRARSGHCHTAVHVERLPGDISGLATGEVHASPTDIFA